MFERVETNYGFIHVTHRENHHYVDLYLPRSMLTRLQLVAGSGVLVQGLSREPTEKEAIHLRPSKGPEHRRASQIQKPFTATIRLPNTEGKLREFLLAAKKEKIEFDSISTRGYRGHAGVHFAFEGVVTNTDISYFDLGQAIAAALERAAVKADGHVVSAYPIQYDDFVEGEVSASLFFSNLPILHGYYGKVRLDKNGQNRIFKHYEDKTRTVRVRFDLQRMTVALDLSLPTENLFALKFKASGLNVKSPIVEAILSALLERDTSVSIDAVEAFEYPEYKPGAGPGEEPIKSKATVNMLFKTDQEIAETSEVEDYLKEKLREYNWTRSKLDIQIHDLAKALAPTEKQGIPGDTTCSALDKMLKNGRYAFIEQLGAGGYGAVSKYFDYKDKKVVAGKHIYKTERFNEDEVRIMEREARQHKSEHIVAVKDYFFDDAMPVIMMEYADDILDHHAENPKQKNNPEKHSVPGNPAELIDMIAQLLQGLKDLHRGDTNGGFLHADIKPSNIGFDRKGDVIIWKLMDFGISKRISTDEPRRQTRTIDGTEEYMSPQACIGRLLESNDIYALGVVVFQMLFRWWHPCKVHERGFGGNSVHDQIGYPEDVSRYAQYEKSQEEDFDGLFEPAACFPRALTTPTFPGLEALRDSAIKDLFDILYKMLSFPTTARFQNAEEVAAALESWRGEHLTT